MDIWDKFIEIINLGKLNASEMFEVAGLCRDSEKVSESVIENISIDSMSDAELIDAIKLSNYNELVSIAIIKAGRLSNYQLMDVIKRSDSNNVVQTAIQTNKLSRDQLLEVIRLCDLGEVNFTDMYSDVAKTAIQRIDFNSMSNIDLLKAIEASNCEYYTVENAIKTGKLNGTQLIKIISNKKFGHRWELAESAIKTSKRKLDSSQIVKLVQLGQATYTLVMTAIETGKLSKTELLTVIKLNRKGSAMYEEYDPDDEMMKALDKTLEVK